MSNQTITVKYHTVKTHCYCCNQKLPVAQTIDKEIVISKETAQGWADWDVVEREDVESMVPEFIYDTISFFSAFMDEDFRVKDGEFERVKEFLLELVGQ